MIIPLLCIPSAQTAGWMHASLSVLWHVEQSSAASEGVQCGGAAGLSKGYQARQGTTVGTDRWHIGTGQCASTGVATGSAHWPLDLRNPRSGHHLRNAAAWLRLNLGRAAAQAHRHRG